MLRTRWLVLVFLVVFVVTLIAGIPASLVASRIPSLPVAGAPLFVGAASGTVWDGSVPLRWRQLNVELDWDLGFRGLTPGLTWSLGGSLKASGWLGGWTETRVEISDGLVPAALIEHVSPFRAEGTLTIDGLRLAVRDQRLVEAAGELRYSGGRAGWKSGETQVPALLARIEEQPEGGVARVTDPSDTLLMEAGVQGERGFVRVYRAWPALLGVSQGGEPTDVVFESSQPIWE